MARVAWLENFQDPQHETALSISPVYILLVASAISATSHDGVIFFHIRFSYLPALCAPAPPCCVQMRTAGRPLPPTSGLPSLRQIDGLTESQLLSALDNLFSIYCPVSVPKLALYDAHKPFKLLDRLAPLPDSGYNSGYTSENEDGDEDGPIQEQSALERDLALLRADEFERTFATRWLEKFISCAAEEDPRPGCFSTDDSQQSAIERAAELLTTLLNPDYGDGGQEEDGQDDGFCREFAFAVPKQNSISVRLNDGLAGAVDHTDVGLQTWGASIVLCRMLCDSPSRFGLTRERLGPSPNIVELGAGTGLVSLVLGQLLPRLGMEQPVVVATDYHPSVISNLRCNIAANFSCPAAPGTVACATSCPVQACALDWARAELESSWPLGDAPADVIIATDVVYAPEHATMLYDCASRILAPGGTFWLLQTVRQNGRHGDVADTVEAVFNNQNSTDTAGALRILEAERLEKRYDVGRADETFYRLFRIGWV